MSNIALVFLSALLIFWAFPPSASVGREFHIGPNQTDRKTAEDYCKINYIDLVTVYDEHDNIKLSNLIKNNKVSNGWIGTRGGESISKKWSNGDDVTFNKSLGDCGELCCAAINADGGWESIKCSEKKPFMCYEQVPDVGRNYSLIRENRTWFDAQLYCRENHTDLVSIRNETENERVMKEREQSNTSFWIGLLEDKVEWEDGGKSAYRNWNLSSNPESKLKYPEAYMDLNGSWYGSTGSTSYPLCYTSERRLREFHIGLNKTNRTDAEIYCKRKYTGLVTVYDEQDNTELSNLVKIKLPSGWIGTRGGNRSKKWSNGDDVTFNKSLGDCRELCCAAMNAEGNWESTQCSKKKPFMCYEQVLDVERKSYKYSLISENRSWFEAQLYCRENHTDLVSIRNETENERVMEEGKQSNTSFWIGLLEDKVEWVDGGKSAYRNWISPNPNTSSHHYPEAYMDLNGKWHINTGSTFYPLCYKSLIHVSEKMSWEDALDYCDTQPNTGLLTIHSHKDQIETEQELNRRNISGPVWVGLRQSRLFGFWIWINGLNVGSYSNWKGGSPPGQISHYCGAIEKVDGQYKWCDKDCRSNFHVLCTVKKD